MSLEIWCLYAATVLAFMLTPGPSHLLMLSNSLVHGFRSSSGTMAGDLSANLLQMLAASLGLVTLLATSQDALSIIKWAGVAYLIWAGIRMWRQSGQLAQSGAAAEKKSAHALYWQGFLTSAANPKAVVFFAALFPQFIVPESNLWSQFAILSVTYLVIDGAFLTAYGLGADRLARRLKGSSLVYVKKMGAVFMIAAAIALGLRSFKAN